MACDDIEQTETAMFESAELHYRLGNYDDAITGYQAFLRQYPTSPLAKNVEMRMRNIHREVGSVLDRQGMPRPIYHGSKLKERQGDEVPPAEKAQQEDDHPDDQSAEDNEDGNDVEPTELP